MFCYYNEQNCFQILHFVTRLVIETNFTFPLFLWLGLTNESFIVCLQFLSIIADIKLFFGFWRHFFFFQIHVWTHLSNCLFLLMTPSIFNSLFFIFSVWFYIKCDKLKALDIGRTDVCSNQIFEIGLKIC